MQVTDLRQQEGLHELRDKELVIARVVDELDEAHLLEVTLHCLLQLSLL